MSVQQERPSNPESIEVPVSGCNSSEGSTEREDALCPAGSALHAENIRLVQQYQLANDWMPLREDMREVAKAYGFEIREIEGQLEFRWKQ
jgi:hypothetical protein